MGIAPTDGSTVVTLPAAERGSLPVLQTSSAANGSHFLRDEPVRDLQRLWRALPGTVRVRAPAIAAHDLYLGMLAYPLKTIPRLA